MTPADLKAARQELGMSVDQLAAWLGLSGNGGDAIRRMESGKRPISGPIARALVGGASLARIRDILADLESGILDGAGDALEQIEAIFEDESPWPAESESPKG